MAIGRLVPLLFLLTGVMGDELVCPEEKLLECKDAPSMKTLFIEDACKYFDLLRNCISQYSFVCAEVGSEVYSKMVQDMMMNKEIFCKDNKPECVQSNLETCFNQYIDLSKVNLQDPNTFPEMCKKFTEFTACYEQAAAPCYSDPTFAQSPFEGIYTQVKINCLSTPECNYFEMSKCSGIIGEGIGLVSTVPTSQFLDTLCNAYIKYEPCMTPLMTSCQAVYMMNYAEFLFQMQATDRYVKMICTEHLLTLLPHTQCYDKPEVQAQVDTSCVNPLMTLYIAGEPDAQAICRQGKAFTDCIKTFTEDQCNGDEAAALVLAGYQEAWVLDTLLNMVGITCPSFGYRSSSVKTTTPFQHHWTGIIIPTTTRTPILPTRILVSSTNAPTNPPTNAPTRAPTNAPTDAPTSSNNQQNSFQTGASSGDICTLSRFVLGISVCLLSLII